MAARKSFFINILRKIYLKRFNIGGGKQFKITGEFCSFYLKAFNSF